MAQGWVYRSTTKLRDGRTAKAGYYRAKYRNATGGWCDHVIVLPNGQKVRDIEVARAALTKILREVEREAFGLEPDPEIHSAALPMRKVLADFIRYVRGQARGREYVGQLLAYNLWIIKKVPITRFADFTTANITAALGVLRQAGVSDRTVNAYRYSAFALGQWAVETKGFRATNPVAKIKPIKLSKDLARKQRRALTGEEARRLLAVAGQHRLFYATAIWTGLRVWSVWQVFRGRGTRFLSFQFSMIEAYVAGHWSG